MPRWILLVGLVLLAPGAFAKHPTSPYFFPGPDLASLLPFTPTQSRAFKKAGVNRVERTLDLIYTTTFLLNDDGRVIKSVETGTGDGKTTEGVTCEYRYNAAGQLTLRSQRDRYNVHHDTIAYDANGVVIFYRSTMSEVKGERPPQLVTTDWELRLASAGPTGNVLRSTTPEDTTLYTFDRANEVIRVNGYGRTDSVTTDPDPSGNTIRRYWYRSDTTEAHVGREEVLRDGNLLSEAQWDMDLGATTPIEKVHYRYDDTGRLLRKERDNAYQRCEFFTYDDNGFVMAHVTLSSQDVRVERYRYWYL